jgi:hypothetical protein
MASSIVSVLDADDGGRRRNGAAEAPRICPLMAETDYRDKRCSYPELWRRLPQSMRSNCAVQDGDVQSCVLCRIRVDRRDSEHGNLVSAWNAASYYAYRDDPIPWLRMALAIWRYCLSRRLDPMSRRLKGWFLAALRIFRHWMARDK